MLKDFLRTPAAVWCAYRNVLGFLKKHSEQDCRNIIEAYVEGGKDGGLTRALIRQACGLPVEDSPPESRVDNPMPPPLPDLPDSQEFAQQEKKTPAERAVGSRKRDLMSEHMTLVQGFLKEGTDYINQSSAARICRGIWAPIKNSDARQALFDELLSMGLWKAVGRRGQIAIACVPVIETKKSFRDVVDLRQPENLEPLTECVDLKALADYKAAPGRERNGETLRSYYEAIVSDNKRKGRGCLPKDQLERREHAQRQMDEIGRRERALDALTAKFGTMDAPSQDRDVNPNDQKNLQLSVRYEYKNSLRSRRYACDAAFQCLPRAARAVLGLKDLHDLDIEAAQWSILVQIVDKLEVQSKLDAARFSFIREYVRDPQGVKSRLEPTVGLNTKKTLLAILNGANLSDAQQGIPDLVKLRSEARLLRWLVCSAYPDAIDIAMYEKRDWPDATAFYYLWTAVEDAILSAAEAFVRQRPYRHLSLHFDGLMVDSGRASEDDFLPRMQAYIVERTGFQALPHAQFAYIKKSYAHWGFISLAPFHPNFRHHFRLVTRLNGLSMSGWSNGIE
jgi:hypothetical protein